MAAFATNCRVLWGMPTIEDFIHCIKLGLYTFRSFASKTKPKTLLKPRFLQQKSGNNVTGFSHFPLVSRTVGCRLRLYCQESGNLCLVSQRRFYSVNRRHFKKWFVQNRKTVVNHAVVGSGVVTAAHFLILKLVPYTKRKRLVLFPRQLELEWGELAVEYTKSWYVGKILPEADPRSIRVRLIAKNIIEALQRGLEEMGVENYIAQHLEGLKWEVLVVNEPHLDAYCMLGGKIVISTGTLQYFDTDAEIATILGHEVGHTVARHLAERLTKYLWIAVLQMVLALYFKRENLRNLSRLFLQLPFSRRTEKEADYIGLMLLASSGYDPRVAPTVYERIHQITGNKGESQLREYLSTHPPGKKRAQLLAQPNVMGKALSIYQKVEAKRGVHGFL